MLIPGNADRIEKTLTLEVYLRFKETVAVITVEVIHGPFP